MCIARFTTRRLLILITVVAVMLGAGIEGTRLWRRAAWYRGFADDSARFKQIMLKMADDTETSMHRTLKKVIEVRERARPMDAPHLRASINRLAARQQESAMFDSKMSIWYRQVASYFELRERRFRRAAARPWEVVATDLELPPIPELKGTQINSQIEEGEDKKGEHSAQRKLGLRSIFKLFSKPTTALKSNIPSDQ